MNLFHTSHFILKILAAMVWYSGVGILFYKSTNLFVLADSNGVDFIWLTLSILSGLFIGWIKARFLFIRICNKNLARIGALHEPKLWQFYRVQFFIFLIVMASLGSYSYKLVQGDSVLLISLAILELSVGTALLLSSHCFWKRAK